MWLPLPVRIFIVLILVFEYLHAADLLRVLVGHLVGSRLWVIRALVVRLTFFADDFFEYLRLDHDSTIQFLIYHSLVGLLCFLDLHENLVG